MIQTRVQFSKKILENENSRIVKSWHHTATYTDSKSAVLTTVL